MIDNIKAIFNISSIPAIWMLLILSATSSAQISGNDIATVSISAVSNTVTEGDTIVFTITRDLAIDQASSITLTLTHNGDFFSPVTDQLILGEHAGVNLNLTNPHRRNGKVYYYLNHNTGPGNDRITHDLLDNLLNDGNDTINTQPGGHDGSDDERSVIIGDYALVLPTGIEIQDFLAAGNNELPNGWVDNAFYWAAGLAIDGDGHTVMDRHERVAFLFDLNDPAHGQIDTNAFDNNLGFVFFQVLTAQRTTVVDFPASQTSMDTVMVEVPTIDTVDAIADGSLIAELIIEQDDSPIELGSTVTSEVVILHNNFVVTVTGIDGGSSVTAAENSSVTLVIHVEPPLPANRALNVNLSYEDDFRLLVDELSSVTVPAGMTTHQFTVSIKNDTIVAQPDRNIDISVATGAGYRASADRVRIIVTDDDTAVVSISPVSNVITEGEDAVFELMLDIVTAGPAAVRVEFTGDDEFFSAMDMSSVVVTFTADEKSTRVAIQTIINHSLFMDGSLIATLTDVTDSPLRISSTQRSATITILDDTPVIGVTTLDGGSFIRVLESTGRVTLQLNIDPTFNQASDVNILYSGDPGALTGDFSSGPVNTSNVVRVPANAATHAFVVEVKDDQIAEFIRRVDVSVTAGSNYVEASSSVEIAVEDDDIATVSISAASRHGYQKATPLYLR